MNVFHHNQSQVFWDPRVTSGLIPHDLVLFILFSDKYSFVCNMFYIVRYLGYRSKHFKFGEWRQFCLDCLFSSRSIFPLTTFDNWPRLIIIVYNLISYYYANTSSMIILSWFITHIFKFHEISFIQTLVYIYEFNLLKNCVSLRATNSIVLCISKGNFFH